jgi:hypothetical protein
MCIEIQGEKTMELLDQYFEIQNRIYEYFGYAEDWRAIPLDDCRNCFWRLDGEGPGQFHYAKTEDELLNETGEYYKDAIFTQRHLSRWVYRGEKFTMVLCDPHVDGNVFLRIVDNAKERT